MKDYGKYFEGYNVPENIKKISVCIMKRFTIIGICDGMYLCNIIASENEIGDGKGNFSGHQITKFEETANTIQSCYGCNIEKEDIKELAEILKNEKLSLAKAKRGIKKFIENRKREKRNCDTWRIDYLEKLISEARQTLSELDR